MRNKTKKIVSVATALLCVPLLCGEICLAEPIVTPGNVSMNYWSGTSETVGNIPPATSFVRGESHEVTVSMPTRDGYEFTGWKLDYTTHGKVNMTVYFINIMSGTDTIPPADYPDIAYPGDTIDVCAPGVDGYNLIKPDCQTITLPDEDVDVTFFYMVGGVIR